MWIRVSTWFKSSQANVNTKLMASLQSSIWRVLANTKTLATGCWTSSSLTMVEASEVRKSFSMWLMISLLQPLGPRDVFVIEVNCLHASRWFKLDLTPVSSWQSLLLPVLNSFLFSLLQEAQLMSSV